MDFPLPEIGEGVYEAELVRWLVKPGDTVRRSQGLLEIMTDKATMEVPSPFAGTITALKVQPGQQVKVGEVILTHSGNETVSTAAPSTVAAAPVASRRSNGPAAPFAATAVAVKASPSVRHLARKLGVNLATLRGTGPQGRILVEDLAPAVSRNAEKAKPALPPGDYGKPGTRIKLQGLRRRIAEHMVHAKKTIPDYSYVDECDVTALVQLRSSLKDAFIEAGIRLTYLPFFVKAVVAALKEVPLVNAYLDEDGGEIVLHAGYHIGIAVSTPAGLIVPVIHDADKKDLATLAREIDRLSEEARMAKSKREDLRGGTFTITSIGNVGGLFSTPIINHPEVGILGIGKMLKRPIYDENGQLRPADMVYLSFSFDHRVVDGAVGAVFGNAVINRLRHPIKMLLPAKL
jgi:pyruvate dehydrogenase E2 component (dihydrolipoamide acetyltransferase)/2-oxoisovalerate dehydrogenase E2 component (dihydrolipoyl transacylase)